MLAALLAVAVIAGIAKAGTNKGAKACCAKSCSVVSQDAGDDVTTFDFSAACRPGSIGLQGEAVDGTTYNVNVCPNCTTLCAPQGRPSGFGAIVQSVGQPPPPGTATCFHPETNAPINCTEPCAVVAVWGGAEFFEETTSERAKGVVTRFLPVSSSSAGSFGAMCGGSRLLQPWLDSAAPAWRTPGALSAAVPGEFLVEMVTTCDVLATTPFVAKVSTPNESEPCHVHIDVRSVAGCAEPKIGVGWAAFSLAAVIFTLATLAGSANLLATEGRCGLDTMPCGLTERFRWCKSRVSACRDAALLGCLRPCLLDRTGGAAEAEAAHRERQAEAEAGARELLVAVFGRCGAASWSKRCCAGRRGGGDGMSMLRLGSSDSESGQLHEVPDDAMRGGHYSPLAQ